MPRPADLALRPDFRLGPLLISPARRLIAGPAGEVHLEPLAMQVLLLLADARGHVVTRDSLFAECWGGIQVSDDSLNRLIASVRRAFVEAAPDRFELETIPRTGYRLVGDPRSDDHDASVLEPVPTRGHSNPPPQNFRRSVLEWVQAHRWWVAATSAILLAALSVVLFRPGIGVDRKPVLVVLPFRALDPQHASLVDGIWEDTRQAIGRNPQIIVLGPHTAQQLAIKGDQAARKAADYLLEASVRTAGDRVRVSTELIRAKDGQQIWSQDFDGKLSDIFALQSEIASEIEGRIRGRLAEKGGTKPQQIATSSEVYALFSDARAKVRTRDQLLIGSAYGELKEAVKADPNFAPAWAELVEAGWAVYPSMRNKRITDHQEEYARRAIDLAPNLAAGHAALALAFNLQGPIAAAEIKHAVDLDPNDFEAWTWIGDSRAYAGDAKGALAAFSRAAAIEPLFWPAVDDEYKLLKRLDDRAGIARLLAVENKLGGDYLVTAIQIDQAYSMGNAARAANLALAYWATGKKEGRTLVGGTAFFPMLQLGLIDEAVKLQGTDAPNYAPFLLRAEPKGLDMFEAQNVAAKTWFGSQPITEIVARAYMLNGQSAKVADAYLSLGLPPDQIAGLVLRQPEAILYRGPILVVALQKNGHAKEASDLLSFLKQRVNEAARDSSPLHLALLARVDAVDGRKGDALALLTRAVNHSWIPPTPLIPVDLHDDPALASLGGDTRFERLREQILETTARQRAQVDRLLLRKFND